MQVKFCKDCKWSKPEDYSSWNLRCSNPYVNANDYWALSAVSMQGTSCSTERAKSWVSFPKCGMAGKQWEAK